MVTIEPDHQVEVATGESILGAACRAGCWLPFECGWGACGTCKATLLEGTVRSLFPAAPAIKPQDERRRRILTCQSTPLSDLRLGQVLARSEARPEFETRLLRGVLDLAEPLGPDLFRLRFGLDRPARFLPGQNAIVITSNGLRRCYSMANRPGEAALEFILRRFPAGPVSSALAELRIGQEIDLELPYGGAYLRPATRPILLVAGGTGIGPMLSILRELVELRSAVPVRVVYGANTEAELVCHDEIADLVARLPAGDYVPAVARPEPGWAGAVGFVTETLERTVNDLPGHELYVSGPPPMVRATLALLQSHAVSIDRIHYDSFG